MCTDSRAHCLRSLGLSRCRRALRSRGSQLTSSQQQHRSECCKTARRRAPRQDTPSTNCQQERFEEDPDRVRLDVAVPRPENLDELRGGRACKITHDNAEVHSREQRLAEERELNDLPSRSATAVWSIATIVASMPLRTITLWSSTASAKLTSTCGCGSRGRDVAVDRYDVSRTIVRVRPWPVVTTDTRLSATTFAIVSSALICVACAAS